MCLSTLSGLENAHSSQLYSRLFSRILKALSLPSLISWKIQESVGRAHTVIFAIHVCGVDIASNRDRYCRRKWSLTKFEGNAPLMNLWGLEFQLWMSIYPWTKKAIDLFPFHVNLHFKSSYIRICPKSECVCGWRDLKASRPGLC